MRILLFCLVGMMFTTNIYAKAQNTNQAFKIFIQQTEKEALKQGILQKTLTRYLSHLKAPIKKTIEHVKQQHTAIVKYDQFLNRFIKSNDTGFGIAQLHKHQKLLAKISKKFGVAPQYIVALWGIESNYGRYCGKSPLIQVLATLAFQNIRSDFYKKELLYALRMVDKANPISQQLISSWDGGMGQPQFMPESYFEYGVDFDKDGFANIWTSTADVFASIANYLHKNGWIKHQPVVVKITLPKDFPINQTGKTYKLSIKEWLKKGIKLPRHYHLQQALSDEAAVIAPDGVTEPAFLVFHNFFILLKWNNSANEGLVTNYLVHLFLIKTKHQPPHAKYRSANAS